MLLLLVLLLAVVKPQLTPLEDELDDSRGEHLPVYEGEVRIWQRVRSRPVTIPPFLGVPSVTASTVTESPLIVSSPPVMKKVPPSVAEIVFDHENNVWMMRPVNISVATPVNVSVIPNKTESSVAPSVKVPCVPVTVSTTPQPCFTSPTLAGSIEDVPFTRVNRTIPPLDHADSKNGDNLWNWKNWTTQGK